MTEQFPQTNNIDPSMQPLPAESGVPSENPAEYLARNFPVEYLALKEAEAGADVQRLDSFITERSAEALRNSEFEETKELKESITGFYQDHYYLAGTIKAIAEGNYNAPIFTKILEEPSAEGCEQTIGSQMPLTVEERTHPSPNARTASFRIAKMAQEFLRIKDVVSEEQANIWKFNILRQCGMALTEQLFSETSVGITTVGDQEITVVRDLAATVKEASGGRVIYRNYNEIIDFPSPDQVVANIERNIGNFWDDTRHAGQLEFHGSPTIGGINLYGLMSRNQQVRTNGSMNVQTMLNSGGDTMHSVVPHFSEFYDGFSYSSGVTGGTLAVPLLKVIQQAPFARDAQYGLLKPKSDEAAVRVPLLTMEMPTGRVGAGESDRVGGGGRDRVFFASPDETSGVMPDDYTVDLFDKVNLPATYIIDRNHDDPKGKRELHDLGVGFGFPERIVIEKGQSADSAIHELQKKYLEAYATYGLVVPLRRGVFAQNFEGVDVAEGKGRHNARIYNRYTYGSEKKSA